MSRRRKEIEAIVFTKKRTKDYDPEDENIASEDDSVGESQDDNSGFEGREHYQAVGKSKLRRPETAPINPKYAGIAVSKSDLASDSDNDPFANINNINEEDDEDPFAESQQRLSSNASDQDEDMKTSEDSEDAYNGEASDGEEQEHSQDEEMEDLQDIDEEESETEGEEGEQSDMDALDTVSARGDLRAFLSRDTKELAHGLSQAAAADATKGRAVKRQYQTFDRILDARMKLQKGLAASDDLKTTNEPSEFVTNAERALRSAQESARAIFDTISSFRDTLAHASPSEPTSRKRKRPELTKDLNDIGTMWERLDLLETEAMPTRRAVIDKWSSREKSFENVLANSKPKERFQSGTNQQDQLTAILDAYVANEQEKQFRGPEDDDEDNQRKAEEDWPAYDDGVFYQSLLRDLITSRSATSSAANNVAGALLPHKLHPSGNQQNKKNVDTKASKGRKVRYTVHEKLQNFMAAEGDTGRDTAMWTERGKNEFFGSLFGQDRVLAEDSEDGGDASDEGVEAEAEALRLFRT